jgi:RNA polymerase sigma-70 factor (ECF subfamily)
MLDETDDDLVRRWQTGEARDEVFAVLQRRYAPEIASALRRMGFEADVCRDLGQETFLQAFRSLDRFRGASTFRTWLHKIARSSGLKHLRQRRTQKRAAVEVSLDEDFGNGHETGNDARPELADPRDGPHERLAAKEVMQRVRVAVGELPPADRRMFRFRAWHGLSVRETAQAMKKPEGTIKSGWSRIRERLEEKLGPHFSDLPP